MSKEYIDKAAFIEYLGFENTIQEREENIGEIVTLEDFDRQPVADVASVAHGRWMHEETEDGFHIWRCSRCGRGMNGNPEGVHLYCYHCGAKMDEFLGSISTLAPA